MKSVRRQDFLRLPKANDQARAANLIGKQAVCKNVAASEEAVQVNHKGVPHQNGHRCRQPDENGSCHAAILRPLLTDVRHVARQWCCTKGTIAFRTSASPLCWAVVRIVQLETSRSRSPTTVLADGASGDAGASDDDQGAEACIAYAQARAQP